MVKISAINRLCQLAKRGAIPAVVACGILVSVGAVHAQATTTVTNPWSIKLGALFPTNDRATDNGGSAQLSAGLDYAFSKTTGTNPVLPSIYADYDGGSKNGGHVDSYGLGVAVRAYASTPSGANRQAVSPYVGAGIGIYNTNAKNNTSFFTRSGNNTSAGGKVFAGLEFTGNYFVEVNYQWLPSEVGINPDGVGVQLGARF